MAVFRQTLREAAKPALGAADRVREQAVVDQADAHAPRASHILGARVRSRGDNVTGETSALRER